MPTIHCGTVRAIFDKVEQHLYRLIAPYCDDPKRELFKTESGNMADMGYGCKAFTISILETAMRVGGSHLLMDCKSLLHLPATPLKGVAETLEVLQERPYKLVCFTKGELQDQENKLKRSGLLKYFDDVEITSDKTQREFLALCEHQHIHPSELLMIGNSLKSDIAPALAIGAWTLHIPFHVTWQLEVHEEFDHERMRKIERFSDVLNYI